MSKILPILLALTMVLSLAACSKEGPSKEKKTGYNSNSDITPSKTNTKRLVKVSEIRGNHEETLTATYSYTYNSAGLERIDHYEGETWYKTQLYNGSTKQFTKCLYPSDDGGEPFVNSDIYYYDNEGRLIRRCWLNTTADHEYDENGWLIRSFFRVNLEDGATWRTIYTYEFHDSGNLKLVSAVSDDGSSKYYDGHGNLIKEISDQGDVTTYDFEYDEEGRVLKSSNRYGSTYYQYDENGLKIESRTDSGVINTFHYNNSELILQVVNQDGSESRFTYCYDSDGYLTERTFTSSESGLFQKYTLEYESVDNSQFQPESWSDYFDAILSPPYLSDDAPLQISLRLAGTW